MLHRCTLTPLASVLGLVAAVGACATPNTQVFGQLSSDTVRLFNGDSVEYQLTLPAVIAGQPQGRMYVYYPFRDLSDSARLRKIALGVFQHFWGEIESSPPPFVVLRAVNLPTAQRKGFYDMRQYGFVIDRRADGHWYFLGESEPVH